MKDYSVYRSVAAWAISHAASWWQTHCWTSFINGGVLNICMQHLAGWTVLLQWIINLWWIIFPCAMVWTTWLRAHWSPPQKFLISLFLQIVLNLTCVQFSRRAAAWSHVVALAQVFVPLCSDLHYSLKLLHWGDLYSTKGQASHDYVKTCQVKRKCWWTYSHSQKQNKATKSKGIWNMSSQKTHDTNEL